MNTSEIEHPYSHYATINAFFTRSLKNGARTICQNQNTIVSPVDGKILEYGTFSNRTLIQAKGVSYSSKDLLNHELSKHFNQGSFITIYLAPKDCHRIFSPINGHIAAYSYVPGALYPVRSPYIEKLDGLYIKNERVTSFISTDHGHVACVKVAAMNVACIDLEYEKDFSQSMTVPTLSKTYQNPAPLAKGDWMATFNLGSTVILLFESSLNVSFKSLQNHMPVQYGQAIAHYS